MSSSTETRGQWLWRKLSAIYGSRFLDMWGNVDPASMQAEWSNALQGVPREALQLAIARLYHTPKVPTLPEFLELCKAAQRPTVAAAITNDGTPREQARERMGEVKRLLGEVLRHEPPGSRLVWAEKLIERAERGEHVTALQLSHARQAIANRKALVMQEREREPGSDDEEVA